MSHFELAFDLVLAAALVAGAAVIVKVSEALAATALFIVFGVMMSIAWARLGAVDLALAEAAIGAGITGALLLIAQPTTALREDTWPRPAPRVAAALAAGGLGAVALFALLAAPRELAGLGPLVAERLAQAGAENPVTAVLLNIRAHDTLLELLVLLAVVVAAWALALPEPQAPAPPAGLLLSAMGRVIVPVTVLIGGYLLWRGAFAPGGAFQGGAVIAGAGVLALLAGAALPHRPRRTLALGLVAGTFVFLVAGMWGMWRGEAFLTYRGEAASRWILAVEVAATISIALALIAVFVGRAPPGRPEAESGPTA